MFDFIPKVEKFIANIIYELKEIVCGLGICALLKCELMCTHQTFAILLH